MSSTASVPVPPPPQTDAPGLSEGARIINTFIAPSKTFTDIRRNASWWVPWLLVAVFSLTFGILFAQRVGWGSVIEKGIAKNASAQARLEQLPPEQRERILATQEKMLTYMFSYGAPVFQLLVIVVTAALCLGIFNFGFGATIPFRQSMAVAAYSFLPLIVSGVLTIATMYAVQPDAFNIQNPLASNPAAWFNLDPDNSRLLYWLGTCFDIFGLWVIALMGTGYSIISNNKVKRTSAIVALFVLYVLVKGMGALRA